MDAIKLLGGLLGNNATGGDLLSTILKGAGGGGVPQQSQSSAGGLLGGLLGGGRSQSAGGADAGMLGNIIKAAVMKQMGMGGGSSAGGPSVGSAAGGLLGSIFGAGAAQAVQEENPLAGVPQQQANDQATILIRAMCNAAKADGEIDSAEQQAIIGRLGGDLDQDEAEFLRNELSSPLDLAGFARSVPRELAPQVYAMSLMTVKVDTRQEAQYLNELAQALGLDRGTVGQIHQQLGVG